MTDVFVATEWDGSRWVSEEDYLAALTPREVPDEVVEEMAKALDPSSWRDYYWEEVRRKYKGQDVGYDPEAFKNRKSIAKVRELLAVLAGWEGRG